MQVKIESSWQKVLEEEFSKPYFVELANFVRSAYTENPGAIFPKGKHIFRALDTCSFEDTRVVILGQDPYPTKGHAHGLCFSVEPDIRPLPKSLVNIFKEIQTDLGQPFPEHGDLSRWAKQGVLLLNSTLTVAEGKPESHARKGWEQFTDAVIQQLSQRKSQVVYMLWGNKAQEKAATVNPLENLVLKTVHPSPLSAHRGFFGWKHFSQCNHYLASHGLAPIEW